MIQALNDLAAAKVFVWLDDLSRPRILSGTLAQMVEHGEIVGITTNPTIFAKAIGAGSGYEDQLRDLALRGTAIGETLRLLTAWDVRAACDVLRTVFDRSQGRDGRVSIEVDPRIRLAAMMEIRTTFVMTHDSIGLGEDGPTHQPVEHLAALRAIPKLAVYRPGDPVETAECWENILDTPRRAALIALSRQPMSLLRREGGTENKSAKGAYVLLEAEGGPRKLTLMSTGSELHLAVEAREMLQKEGIPTAVVSMPCRLLFEEQDADYRKAVMGDTHARVAVEAAVEFGWERYLGFQGRFVGMHTFGESGKIADVYRKFDITTEAVVRAAREVVRDVHG